MNKLLCRALFVLSLLIVVATAQAKERQIVLKMSGSAQAKDYFIPIYTPVDVPRGATKILVEQSFSAPDGGRCNFDLGVFDSRGHGLSGDGFRGWSGGARRSFEISCSSATPGYLAGEIHPGRWHVVQMYTSRLPLAEWSLAVTITVGGRQDKPRVASFAAEKLNDTPLWYRFDTHVHTVHSDGASTPAEIVAMGKAAGLDGIISTDHNTTAALLEWGTVQDTAFLVVNGMEVTYVHGHWNILGMKPTEWVDFRYHYADRGSHFAAVDRAKKMGALTVANHPCIIDFQYDKTTMDGIEVWNGAWNNGNEAALAMWDGMLRCGIRKFAIAGTDYHKPKHNLGSPQTVVCSQSLSSSDVLGAIAEGRSYMALSSVVDVTMAAVCGSIGRAGIGETLVRRGDIIVEFGSNQSGLNVILIDQSGEVWRAKFNAHRSLSFTLPQTSKWVRAEMRADSGDMVALTNPIFIVDPMTDYPLIY